MLKLFFKISTGFLKGKCIWYCKFYDLRPTSSIVKETLFNWLNDYLKGSKVLDLFSGTGILSFELLSRGVNSVYMIENNVFRFDQLILNKSNLCLNDECIVVFCESIKWLKMSKMLDFNIILLDPPYDSNLLKDSFFEIDRILFCYKIVFIYFEFNDESILYFLPYSWILLKKSKIGNVFFYLFKKIW